MFELIRILVHGQGYLKKIQRERQWNLNSGDDKLKYCFNLSEDDNAGPLQSASSFRRGSDSGISYIIAVMLSSNIATL